MFSFEVSSHGVVACCCLLMSWLGVSASGTRVGGTNEVTVGPAVGALVHALWATCGVGTVGCKAGGDGSRTWK